MFKIAQPCSEKNLEKVCDGSSCPHQRIAIRSPNSPVIVPQRKEAAIRKMVKEEMERDYDGSFFPKIKTKAELFEERLHRTMLKRKAAQKKIAMIRKARREELEEKERKKAERLRKKAEKKEKKELEKAAKRNETLYKVAEIQTLPTAKVRKMVRKAKGATLKKRPVLGPNRKGKKLRNEKTLKAAPKKRDEKPRLSVPKSAKSLVALTLQQKIAMEKAKKSKMAIQKKRHMKPVRKLPGKKDEKPTKSAKLKASQNEQDETKNAKKQVKKSFIQINRENVRSGKKSSKFSFLRSSPLKKPTQLMATSKKDSRKELNEVNLEKVVKIEVPKSETKNEIKPNDVPQKSEIKIVRQINPPVLQLATTKFEKVMVDKCLSPKESFSQYPLKPTSQIIANLKSKKNKTLQKTLNSITNARKSQFNKSLKTVKPEVKKFDYEAQKLKDKLNYMKEMSKISQEENANLKRERNLKKQILSETSWRYKRNWKPKVEISTGKTELAKKKEIFAKRFELTKSPRTNYFRDFEKKFELPKPILRSNLRKNLEKIVGSKNERNLKVENEVLKMSAIRPGLDSEDQKRLSENVLNLASTIYNNTPCKFEKYMMDNIKKSGSPYLKAAKTVLSQREHSKESIISILMNILHSGLEDMKQENRANEMTEKSYENHPHNIPSPIEIWGQVGERPESFNMFEEIKDGVKLGKRSEDRFGFEEKVEKETLEGEKSTAEGDEEEKNKKTEAEHLAEVAQKLAMKAENLAKSNKLYDSESIFAQLSSATLSPTTGRRSFFKKKVAPVDKKKAKKEKRSRSCRREDDYSETDSSSLESLNSQGYRESDLIQIKGVEHEPMILTTYKNTEYKVVTPLKDLLRERNKSRLPDDPTNERGFYGFSTELFWANQRNSSDSD